MAQHSTTRTTHLNLLGENGVATEIRLAAADIGVGREHLERACLTSAIDTQEAKALAGVDAKGQATHCMLQLAFALVCFAQIL